ncbi:MAG: hypothetical protein D6714_05640 [Bacteroidetes bacterium]|nr:MAG: hypothetical protein D6714_05640 [Bacteroidota bacterium]
MDERTVQVHALEFLEKRARKRARRGRCFARMEVRTKARYGNKRADGLLAFKHWLSGTYVVSLEAKSHKTLPAIVPKTEVGLLVWNSFRAGLLVCILTGAFFAFFKMDDGLLQILLPLNTLGVGALGYGIITRNHFSHKNIAVVKQIGQYPANEQWLAFSRDSIARLPVKKVGYLKTICRERGIGVLVVSPGGKIEVFVKAKYRINWWGDFLKYYAPETEIRRFLA